MALKQHFTQRQDLRLSPQQIQLMKLLQIPAAELEQRIQQEIEENPALEQGDERETNPWTNKNRTVMKRPLIFQIILMTTHRITKHK